MFGRIDKTDLFQFGFDGSQFKKVNGGREWQGPCPWCGGKDRMVISNGKYWCRQNSQHSGTLISLLKEPPTQEEIEQAKRIAEAKEKKEKEEQEKAKKITLQRFNKEKPWIAFHKNLLNHSEALALLEKDGITRFAVEYFKLGYIDSFQYWIDGAKHFSPALTFPIRQGKIMYNMRCRILAQIEGDKYRPWLTKYDGIGASFFTADYPNEDFVVIVEGEKKAIVLWLNGIPTVGIQGCYTFKEEWVSWFKRHYKHVYLALDPDEGGQKGAHRLRRMLNAKSIKLTGKPDDLFVSGQLTLEQFIQEITTTIYGGNNHE